MIGRKAGVTREAEKGEAEKGEAEKGGGELVAAVATVEKENA